jgi:hypothetical protein
VQIDQQQLETPASVSQFVHQVLCEAENLERDHFPLAWRTLANASGPCGMLFCLHGPRQMQLTAVWEIERNVIWFYNSRGERFRKTLLR